MWHDFFENPDFNFFTLELVTGTAQLGRGAIIAQRLWKIQRLWVSEGDIEWVSLVSDKKEFSIVRLNILCSSKNDDQILEITKPLRTMVYDLTAMGSQWRLYSAGEETPELGTQRLRANV